MIIILFIVFILFLINPHIITNSARESLNLALFSVLPSLFPLMVISKILAKTINFDFKIIRKIFSLSKKGANLLFIGLICGYPIGAKILSESIEKKEITKKEGDRIFLFINNSAPAFVIGTVGSIFLKDINLGIYIYLTHIFSSLTMGVLLSFNKKEEDIYTLKSRENYLKIISESLGESIISSQIIVGVIVFSGALISAFLQFKIFDITVISGLIEMTNGIKNLNFNLYTNLFLSEFFITFGGFSIFMQIASLTKNMDIKKLVIFKFITALFSGLFVILSYRYKVHFILFIFIILSVIKCIKERLNCS